ALESAREWQIQRARGIFLEQTRARVRDDADNFDRHLRGAAAFFERARPAVTVTLRLRRVLVGKLNLLTKRIAIGPQFFREHFIDDGDLGGVLMHGFGSVEGTAGLNRNPDRPEI